jgi:hypothetical protein
MPKDWLWMVGIFLALIFVVFNVNPFGIKNMLLGIPASAGK